LDVVVLLLQLTLPWVVLGYTIKRVMAIFVVLGVDGGDTANRF
jgi:hypothetical protein